MKPGAETTPGPRLLLPDAAHGSFELKREVSGDETCLRFRLTDGDVAPHWTRPLLRVELRDAVRLFRTGLGFSGPTNFVPLPRDGTLFSYESYLVTAFVDADGRALVVYTRDHDRFLARTEVYNRVHRHEFRNRRVTSAPVYVDVGFSTEAMAMPEEGLELPPIYLLSSDSAWEGVSEAARRIARHNRARVTAKPPRFYCSWYHWYARFSESDLEDVLRGFDPEQVSMETVQIDDGYAPAWGDWLEPHPEWPSGMAGAARAIAERGARPGIWVAPFAVEEGSVLMREHPDWVLRGTDGEPVRKMASASATADGPGHRDRYALDASHPAVREHIGTVFRTLHEWGFRFFKTDFMDWGYVDSTEVRRHTAGKTSAMWFDQCLRIIRQAIGEESYWLACISYFEPFVGYCDGMRVSSDVGAAWCGDGGTGNDGVGGGLMNVLQETYHDQFFNRVFWNNDPDVIFLRKTDTELDDEETRSLALWSAMLGGAVSCSDPVQHLPPDRRRLWEEVVALQDLPGVAQVPCWGSDLPIYVLVRRAADGRFVVLALNPGEAAFSGALSIERLTGFPRAAIVESDAGANRPGPVEALPVALAPHQCCLTHLSTIEPVEHDDANP